MYIHEYRSFIRSSSQINHDSSTDLKEIDMHGMPLQDAIRGKSLNWFWEIVGMSHPILSTDVTFMNCENPRK